MRVALFIVALTVIAGSIYADYRWKRWIARQHEQRQRSGDDFKR